MEHSYSPEEDPELIELAQKCFQMMSLQHQKKERSLANLEMQMKRTCAVLPDEVLNMKCQTFVREFNCDLNLAVEKILADKALNNIPKDLSNRLLTPKKKKQEGGKFMLKKKGPKSTIKSQTDRPDA